MLSCFFLAVPFGYHICNAACEGNRALNLYSHRTAYCLLSLELAFFLAKIINIGGGSSRNSNSGHSIQYMISAVAPFAYTLFLSLPYSLISIVFTIVSLFHSPIFSFCHSTI
ncbi:hypothetical protein BX070DRAFT_38827 [Coemansia spiralis]|nr:hypothetical protein BX070DRAFT_38827 [Coemansia spiralis]